MLKIQTNSMKNPRKIRHVIVQNILVLNPRFGLYCGFVRKTYIIKVIESSKLKFKKKNNPFSTRLKDKLKKLQH